MIDIDPSVMVLVKNEEHWLPYVLKQCEGVFNSFVIYDVGSTDRTRDIINWFYERNKDKAEIFIRLLPHCSPDVQGTFRNSMIIEGKRETYLILDGDELYTPDDLDKVKAAAIALGTQHIYEPRKKYGVFSRVEVSSDLKRQYVERPKHHRLYTKDAFWKGTHPGERVTHKQNLKSEINFYDITCWHMHNTLRSSKEKDALSRLKRKNQSTYHPGNTMDDLNVLKELPVLRTPIEDFPVCPALKEIQNA